MKHRCVRWWHGSCYLNMKAQGDDATDRVRMESHKFLALSPAALCESPSRCGGWFFDKLESVGLSGGIRFASRKRTNDEWGGGNDGSPQWRARHTGLSAISASAVVLSLTRLDPLRFIRQRAFLVSLSHAYASG